MVKIHRKTNNINFWINPCNIFFVLLPGEDQEDDDPVVKEIKEPKQELKTHLNGLYNGLAKIMMTPSSNVEGDGKTSPFVIEKAVHNIMFIKHHMKAQDEFDAVSIIMLVIF